MSTTVAINGRGRIEVQNLAYLLRFDTVYGRYSKPGVIDGSDLIVAGRKLRTLRSRDPAESDSTVGERFTSHIER